MTIKEYNERVIKAIVSGIQAEAVLNNYYRVEIEE